MVVIDIDYPKNGCSTPCPAMRCQKCILKDSVSVFDYIVKERKQDRPDWCPILPIGVKKYLEVKDED